MQCQCAPTHIPEKLLKTTYHSPPSCQLVTPLSLLPVLNQWSHFPSGHQLPHPLSLFLIFCLSHRHALFFSPLFASGRLAVSPASWSASNRWHTHTYTRFPSLQRALCLVLVSDNAMTPTHIPVGAADSKRGPNKKEFFNLVLSWSHHLNRWTAGVVVMRHQTAANEQNSWARTHAYTRWLTDTPLSMSMKHMLTNVLSYWVVTSAVRAQKCLMVPRMMCLYRGWDSCYETHDTCKAMKQDIFFCYNTADEKCITAFIWL